MHYGCGILVGNAENVAGNVEEFFPDRAGCALCLSGEVVANAEEGSIVVVEVFPHHEVEVVGEVVAAIDGEMIQVVDDNE